MASDPEYGGEEEEGNLTTYNRVLTPVTALKSAEVGTSHQGTDETPF